jgi:hypothetical protein
MSQQKYRVIQWMTGDVDIESIMATDADCVFYTPIIMNVETVCRILRSGKNVVTTRGFLHPTEDFREGGDQTDVCDAVPGRLTHLDLGLIRPRGLVRK